MAQPRLAEMLVCGLSQLHFIGLQLLREEEMKLASASDRLLDVGNRVAACGDAPVFRSDVSDADEGRLNIVERPVGKSHRERVGCRVGVGSLWLGFIHDELVRPAQLNLVLPPF